MWLLKSYAQPIPGNYFFVQRNGIYHTFPAKPLIEELAKDVSSFRIANKLPRAGLAETLEDIDTFNCQVRNNDPKWCRESKNSFEAEHSTHRFIKQSCASCGSVVPP